MVESEQLQMDVAGRLKEMTAALGIPFIFKSSYDKANRSSGSSFRGPGESLFHFDVERIDAAGLLIRAEPSFPLRLSSRRFALARLKSELASYAPEYVFSRAAFDRAGRF